MWKYSGVFFAAQTYQYAVSRVPNPLRLRRFKTPAETAIGEPAGRNPSLQDMGRSRAGSS